MKNITKVCILLSGIFLVLGAACITAGAFLGVTPSQLVHQSSYTDRFFTNKTPLFITGTASEESHTFTDVESLDLEVSMCDLTIYQHELDHIALTAQNVNSHFSCRQEGNTLVVKDDRPSSTKQNSMDDALKLILYLPQKEMDEISMEVSLGEIFIEQMNAYTIDIECDLGSFQAEDLICRELQFENNIGEVRFGQLQVSDSAKICTDTGDIELDLFEGPSLHTDCGIGNTVITASGAETDYNYKIDSQMGDSYVNHHHHTHRDDLDDIPDNTLTKDHHAGKNIEIQCGLGNITLNFTEESL